MDQMHRIMEAQRDANDARHNSEKALMNLKAHEDVCAVRYGTIDRQLTDIRQTQATAAREIKESVNKIYAALDGLKATANRASGADVTIRYACLLIAAAGVIWGFTK